MAKSSYDFTRHFSDRCPREGVVDEIYRIYALFGSSSLLISREDPEVTMTPNRRYLWNEPPTIALVGVSDLEDEGFDINVHVEVMPSDKVPQGLRKLLADNKFETGKREH